MKLTKKSETATKITFTYDRPPGPVEGYLYYAGGVRVSRTFNPSDLEVTFGKVESGKYAVEAVTLVVVARAEWPEPPAPVSWPTPPVGPFQQQSGDHFYRDGNGLTTEKIHVTSAPGWGLGNMRWPYEGPSTGIWTLRDCKVQNVSANPPRSMDGTGEAGYWVGEKTVGERLEAWNTAWMNMWLGAACKGSRFTDLNLYDPQLIGLYVEHPADDVEFKNSRFGGGKARGSTPSFSPLGSSINAEWWYPDSVYGHLFPFGGKAGSRNVRFIDCEIYCPLPAPGTPEWRWYQTAGAFLDAGTYDYLFERCRFYGPGRSVGLPNNTMDPSKPNRVIDCVFDNALGGVYYHDNEIG
jgi:hypothetical protein